MSALELLLRVAVSIPTPVKRALAFPLLILPSFRRQARVLKVQRQIHDLEAKDDFDAARDLRSKALAEFSRPFSAVFWNSEGWDRLRRNDSQGALEAFERGIEDIADAWPPDAAIAEPANLYYGAAVASLQLGDIERSRGHYGTLKNLVSDAQALFPKSLSHGPATEALEFLRTKLGEA